MVLLGDGGLDAVPDDVGVGRLLEVDEHAERDLGQEDDHQEQEELQNGTDIKEVLQNVVHRLRELPS